jgi:hypothetical protein
MTKVVVLSDSQYEAVKSMEGDSVVLTTASALRDAGVTLEGAREFCARISGNRRTGSSAVTFAGDSSHVLFRHMRAADTLGDDLAMAVS